MSLTLQQEPFIPQIQEIICKCGDFSENKLSASDFIFNLTINNFQHWFIDHEIVFSKIKNKDSVISIKLKHEHCSNLSYDGLSAKLLNILLVRTSNGIIYKDATYSNSKSSELYDHYIYEKGGTIIQIKKKKMLGIVTTLY